MPPDADGQIRQVAGADEDGELAGDASFRVSGRSGHRRTSPPGARAGRATSTGAAITSGRGVAAGASAGKPSSTCPLVEVGLGLRRTARVRVLHPDAVEVHVDRVDGEEGQLRDPGGGLAGCVQLQHSRCRGERSTTNDSSSRLRPPTIVGTGSPRAAVRMASRTTEAGLDLRTTPSTSADAADRTRKGSSGRCRRGCRCRARAVPRRSRGAAAVGESEIEHGKGHAVGRGEEFVDGGAPPANSRSSAVLSMCCTPRMEISWSSMTPMRGGWFADSATDGVPSRPLF